MMVGEAPSAKATRPFDSASGRILMKMLTRIGVSSTELYMTNLIKCPLPERSSLSYAYIRACIRHLESEVRIIRPKIVVLLGSVTSRYVLSRACGRPISLYRVHGRVFPAKLFGVRTLLLPMYHPAVIFYNPRLLRVVERDFLILADLIDSMDDFRN